MADKFKNNDIKTEDNRGLTKRQELEIREIIAAALANWTGVTRFRTLETTIISSSDFTNAQHNHENAAGGGQIDKDAISGVIDVPHGGTGVNTLTGIVKGNGAGVFTAVTPISGTKQYYVADTSGGAVTRRLTFTDGVLTSEA